MLMVLLYGLAAFAETGVSIWIFAKMFPKRERGDAYRIGERILLALLTFFTYTSLKQYMGININLRLLLGTYFFVIVFDIFLSKISEEYAMKVRKEFLLIYMCILLTIQYWSAYLSAIVIVTGNVVVPFFLFVFFRCSFLQAYLWEVLYVVNIGLLKVLYVFAVGLLKNKTVWDYVYSGYHSVNSYIGVTWMICIVGIVVLLRRILDIDSWMGKLLRQYLYLVSIVCVIECGLLFFLIYLSNTEIKLTHLIVGFVSITGFMIALLLIAVRYYMKNLTAEKNILEVRNKVIAHQYQELDENYRKYRCLVHDEKYLLNYIGQCIDDGRIEEIQRVIKKRQDQFAEKVYWTGISIIDNVIALEKQKIDKQKIEFQLEADVTDIFMDEMDFIILFENVFNNAIEATSKCADKRMIKLFIKNINDTFLLKVWNTSSKLPSVKGTRFLTDKKDATGHGWGVESVRHIVEKYEGEVIFRYDDDFFEVVITIGKQ